MNGKHPGDDRLIAYVLDELGGPERSDVEAHVRDCAACRRVARRLSGAVEAYRSTRDAGAPAGVLIDMLEAQAAARDRTVAPWWQLKPILASATLALVAMLFLSGFWAGRSSAPASSMSQALLAERAEIPRPLPTPPVIGFQAERPLSVRFALADEATLVRPGDEEKWESLRDSL